MKKEKDSKPFYKKVWFWILVAILAIGVTNSILKNPSKNTATKAEKTSSAAVEQKFKMTKELGEDFALYFKDNAEIIDKGEKVDFVPGGNDKHISVRIGENWKNESSSRKIYISNEFLKAKNTIFEKWAQEKGYNVDLEKDTPQLLVYTSDSDKTQISQEYKGEMKILK
ncbi:hypothetical protein ATE37_01175 [Streptococcus oralis subsp. tigurinus]|jgi:hypothetical protein|uniref:Uncharacterized protein n=1 Tax=Streptococcus oralis subsp. tigurinus TaxID=1077464 RepID=A0A1X0X1E1_STROR|nr:hypothetical protein [Streptococcus oralis]ORJ32816.1 hypothetical protein ATE37_01175 [Streptococcus oralis subsp. tigurinus]DAX46793.1 MAG TPA: hypothetical protein [Caudoviricetes sp.]DAX59753.1 MAG TPA: hypothetical protein [Caudoviricetes sp.]